MTPSRLPSESLIHISHKSWSGMRAMICGSWWIEMFLVLASRVQCVDVGSSEIDERAGSGAGMVRTLSGVEVKADAATIEEGHVWGGHQQRQAKGIAIKGCRAVDFFYGDRDLKDSGDGCGYGWVHAILLV